MTKDTPDDVLLGRSLAETARLNAPEQVAGRRAKEAVTKAAGGRWTSRQRLRAFWTLAALMLLVIAGVAFLLWRLGPA